MTTRKVDKAGITATKVDFEIEADQPDRTLFDILKIIAGSDLGHAVKHDAARVFELLAGAEGAAHRKVPSAVHFHEVGALDAILDINGAAACLKLLDIKKVYASPVTVSQPATATTHLLKNMNAGFKEIGIENVTPTGAALVKALAEQTEAPTAIIRKIGYGAGDADTESPNVLRVWIGDMEETKPFATEDTVVLMESNIDDLNPEEISFALSRLLEIGALDVWCTPIIMKKGRPAYVLSCLAEPGRDAPVIDAFFRETSTLGIRTSRVSRQILRRETIKVKTDYGEIRIKTGWLNGAAVSARPEYEDCAAAARKKNEPLRKVYEAALKALPTK